MSLPPPQPSPAQQPPGPAPLDQPQYGATIGQAASRFWKKFAVFSGRASRSEYWWWVLISVAVSVVLQVIGTLTIGGGFTAPRTDLREALVPLVPSLIWSLVVLVPSVALTVRRLHDTNRSGWWYLLALPSLAGAALQLVALGSMDVERLAAGDLAGGIAVGPLVASLVLTLLGLVGSIVMLVFLILGPDPRGARFDRRR